MMATGMPGLGHRCGGSPTDQQSYGYQSERVLQTGSPRRRLLGCLHQSLVLQKYCHKRGKWNPRPGFEGARFCGAIWRELGSKVGIYPAEISCYQVELINKYSVMSETIQIFTISVLRNTIRLSCCWLKWCPVQVIPAGIYRVRTSAPAGPARSRRIKT